MFSQVFTNVWFLVSAAVFTFLATLAAAVYVVWLEGNAGCGGGTVGAMIPVAAGFAGLLVGLAVRFTPDE